MKLYFVRHGQSVGNLSGDYSTSFHGQLSENGVAQAEALIQKLKDYKFDNIIVSPIERAVKTILPYLRENNLVAELWGELAEGCWQEDKEEKPRDGTRYGDAILLDENDMRYFRFRDDDRYNALPPEDENYQEGLQRITCAYKRILKDYMETDKAVLVVGHGHTGSRLLELFLGMEPLGSIDHSNTGLSIIEETPMGNFEVKYINL